MISYCVVLSTKLPEFEKAAVLRDQVKDLNLKLQRKLKAEGIGQRGKVG